MNELKVGLQLYSIRDAMNEDMDAALKAVKEMGYDCVEFAGGRYGHTAAETKALCEKYGLECVSVHQGSALFLEDEEDAVAYIKEMGVKFCVIPMTVGRLDTLRDHWDETIALYKRMYKAFREIGVQLLYHNHDFELITLEGDSQPVLDRLYREIPDLKPQFDTCWISYGGYAPAEYIREYGENIDLIHVKDYSLTKMEPIPIHRQVQKYGWSIRPESRSDAGFVFTPLGTGVVDFDPIIEAAKASNARYLIVEQDKSPDRDPLKAAAMSRRFLKETYGI